MSSSKRQKIIDTMQMLDEEKEVLTSNTYVHMTDCLLDLYKVVDEGLYVLKWIVFIPVYVAAILLIPRMSISSDHSARR